MRPHNAAALALVGSAWYLMVVEMEFVGQSLAKGPICAI
jgi:hypothetical protein